MINEVLIKGRHGGRIDVRKGQFLEIINVEGQQICDFFAFNKGNVREHLSPSHTRSVNARIYLRQGDVLSTVLRRPMLKLVEDTCGQHDMTIPACDAQRYLISYNLADHRSCRMNLFQMIAPEGIPYEYLPDPINFFQNTPVGADFHYHRAPSPSKAGDKVVLEALMDLIAVGSACPQDMTGSNGNRITDIKFLVRDGLTREGQ